MVFSLHNLCNSSILQAIQYIRNTGTCSALLIVYYYYQSLTISLRVLFSKTSVDNNNHTIQDFSIYFRIISNVHEPRANWITLNLNSLMFTSLYCIWFVGMKNEHDLYVYIGRMPKSKIYEQLL